MDNDETPIRDTEQPLTTEAAHEPEIDSPKPAARDFRPIPPSSGRERRGVPPVAWGMLFGCGPWILLLFLLLAGVASLSRGGSGTSGPYVAIIPVTGVITAGDGASSAFSLSGGAGSMRIVELLRTAAKDRQVKAIVMRVDSPGGSPVGSHEIYNEVRRIRRVVKKPVVVSMGDLAASGGYYCSASADRIFANPGTMTGSIGVIMQLPQLAELLDRLGANLEVLKSGRFKDTGNFARPLTPEDRKLLQALIMEVYDQFVTAVAEGRNLPKSQVRAIADGRVLTGSQALRHRLVDELGGLREAVAYAGKQGGIEGEPNTKIIGKPSMMESLLGSESDDATLTATRSAQLLRLMADPRVRDAIRSLLVPSPARLELR